jgi:glutathione synthase/RimK-type ligase-like ATP-grasp enzyme
MAWDDPGADWSRARLTVLRSTWNYPRHPEAFLAWAAAAASCSTLWNPLPVVRWNAHKSYLLDLERRGLPVVPTALVRRGSPESSLAIAGDRGWHDVVIKPAVSAASFRTRRFGPGEHAAAEAHLRGIVAERDALVQEYLPGVEDRGERALVWIDGELTHAVRKSPRFAGESEAVSEGAVEMTPAETQLAHDAVAAAGGPLLYARADIAPGRDGRPVLMELELIEPSLFFAQAPRALERFVQAIRRRL